MWLLTILYLTVLVWQSPHLVHHAFSSEPVETECILAAGADHAPASVAQPVDPGAPIVVALPATPAVSHTWADSTHAPLAARAPPRPIA